MADKILDLSTGICEISLGWAPREICAVKWLSFLKEMDCNMGVRAGAGGSAELT